MRVTLDLEIEGRGIIFYLPFAIRHIAEGQDCLQERFWKPSDVAEHVMACQRSAFSTGSPGRYRLHIYDGSVDRATLETAECR